MIELVNLHYSNFLGLDYPVDWLMKSVNYSLGQYIRYIAIATQLMWAPARLQKVKWKLATSEVLGKGSEAPLKKELQGVWVEIEEAEEKEDVDTIEDFANAESVIETPDRRSPRIRVLDADSNKGLLRLEREPRASDVGAGNSPDFEGKPSDAFLYLPPNDYVLYQQGKALAKLRDRPEPEHRGLVRLLEDSSMVRWPIVNGVRPKGWEFLTDDTIEGTREQRGFVEVALGTPDFAVLEGPPGSGKTTSICEFIVQEAKRNHRVLLCASTHVAVDNVLEFLQDRGATSKDVLAVRIGDARRISERVRDFQLEIRAGKETEDLIWKLSRIKTPTVAQKFLLEALQSSPDRGKGIISRLILESSNLVCGTTVGILQHPDIKAQRAARKKTEAYANRKGETVVRPFDCLIVDEASKTTFQEFLVPALFTKRWILVGDVRQLSPYVEETQVEDNVKAMLRNEEDARVCLSVFQSWSGSRRLTQGVLVVDPADASKYESQAEKLGLSSLDLTEPQEASWSSMSLALSVLGSHVTLCRGQDLPRLQRFMPIDTVVSPTALTPKEMLRRYEFWLQHTHAPISEILGKDPLSEWAKNVAWRLSRSFELREDPEQARFHDQAVQSLLPQWYGEEGLRQLISEIEIMKRIALPSALELVQKGFGRRADSRSGTCLTDGMNESAFSQRRVPLSYQHRMHPEISRFPREHVYDSASLKDPEDIARKRSWTFSGEKPRAGWVQTVRARCDSRNRNLTEAEIVMQELESFIHWASSNPRQTEDSHEGSWEVAILTFYRGQESLLRALLQGRFRSRYRTEFRTADGTARIRLFTVDRFQGHEADLVILSFARTGRIGFLDSPNRLNVAITRPRYQLLMIGSQSIFARQKRDTLLKKLAIGMPTLRVAWGKAS